MSDIDKKISKSASDFENIVWPEISNRIGGGRIKSVEATVSSKEFAHELDVYAGIDAWQLIDNYSALRGIASRIQWHNPKWKKPYPFNTFSVRTSLKSNGETEYHKRLFAINNPQYGLLFPTITVLLSYAIMQTTNLYGYIEEYGFLQILLVKGGNHMGTVRWLDIKNKGYKILMMDDDDPLGLFK